MDREAQETVQALVDTLDLLTKAFDAGNYDPIIERGRALLARDAGPVLKVDDVWVALGGDPTRAPSAEVVMRNLHEITERVERMHALLKTWPVATERWRGR